MISPKAIRCALLFAAATAAPLAHPQALQPAEFARALCTGNPSDALNVVLRQYSLGSTNDLSRALVTMVPLPAELEFADAFTALERARDQLKATKQAAADFARLQDALLAVNGQRNQERSIQQARGGSGPAALGACPCIDTVGAELKEDVSLLELKVKQLEALASEKLAVACVTEKTAATNPDDQNVPPGQAKLTRTLAEFSDWNGWKVTDGRIAQPGPGQKKGYSGEYTWSLPPTEIGEKGFTMTLTVTAKADKGARLGTGIQASAEGLLIQSKSGKDLSAYAEDGSSETKTTTITVLPPENVRKGEVFKLSVGPFYGPKVTYTFVGK